MDVLNGAGTEAQQNVVLCNAALALQTIDSTKSFADCFYTAEESLVSKKALSGFKTLTGR
jgi:anthranilate phosphoribosyltransferase